MSTQFGLMTDGTLDIYGINQEVVCVRYVDDGNAPVYITDSA